MPLCPKKPAATHSRSLFSYDFCIELLFFLIVRKMRRRRLRTLTLTQTVYRGYKLSQSFVMMNVHSYILMSQRAKSCSFK